MNETFGTILAIILLVFLFNDDHTGMDNWDRLNHMFTDHYEECISGKITREEY